MGRRLNVAYPSQDCATWWTYKGQMGWENDMSAHEQAQKPFSNFFFHWCCVHRFLCAILLQEKVGDDKSWSFNSNKLEAVTKLAAPVVRKSDWPAVNVTVRWFVQTNQGCRLHFIPQTLLMGLLPGGYVICDASRRFAKTFYVVPQGSAKDRQLTHGPLQPFTAMGPEMLPGKPQHTRIRREADAFLFSICLFDWGCFV